MVEGYNIALTIGGKTLCGRTQDDLTIAAKVKESITKDDEGETQRRITGHDVSFSVSGLIEVGNSAATKLDRDDVIAMALAKGSQAEVTVVYSCANGDSYTGTAIITNYTESSNSEDDATYGLDLQISGEFAIVS